MTMDFIKEQGKKIEKQVADAFGTTAEEVAMEIENALYVGRTDPDPAIRGQWSGLVSDGETPTPEQLLFLLVGEVLRGC